MKKIYAVAWASGLIEFKDVVPDGAVPICQGPEKKVRRWMVATARHGQGKSAGKLLVPGVPEADSQADGMDALLDHMAWLKKRVPDGVVMGRG